MLSCVVVMVKFLWLVNLLHYFVVKSYYIFGEYCIMLNLYNYIFGFYYI